MTEPATRYVLENLTLQEATIATQAIGRHRLEERCTCKRGLTCKQCHDLFYDDSLDSYENANAEEAAKTWQEHVREA